MQATNRSTQGLLRTPQRRRPSSSSPRGSGRGGCPPSSIGLRLLISSESTIKKESRTSDEHDRRGSYGNGVLVSFRASCHSSGAVLRPCVRLRPHPGNRLPHPSPHVAGDVAGRRAAHGIAGIVGELLVADQRRTG